MLGIGATFKIKLTVDLIVDLLKGSGTGVSLPTTYAPFTRAEAASTYLSHFGLALMRSQTDIISAVPETTGSFNDNAL